MLIDLEAIKNEIENIKTHFATKFNVARWTLGIGVAAVIAIGSMIMHLDNRLTQDIKELRKDVTEGQKDMREMQVAITTLSKKVDKLSDKVETLSIQVGKISPHGNP